MSSTAQSFLLSPSRGEIITFYSYKGGTGRSMAVANIACLLSKRLSRTSKRVLVMDWDLEAPGLHRFFSAKSERPEYEKTPGVINYFEDLRNLFNKEPKLYKNVTAPEGWRALDALVPLEKYCIPDVVQGVDFMRAGLFGPEYAKLVGSFSWIRFFHEYGGVIKAARELLVRKFAYTLVDSRTGLTDVSGICTALLPEKLVGVFTPNQQSLYGLRDLVKEALEYRRRSEDDFRPLSVFPLPSRIDLGEKELREKWGEEYQAVFESLFREALAIKKCDLTAYFNEVQLPQIGYFAYGEKIAILQERPDAISLSAAYERFFDRLINSSYAWEMPGAGEPSIGESATAPASDEKPKYDAFLSYAVTEETSVSKVDKQLQRYGTKTFRFSRDIVPGEEWQVGYAAGLAQSKALIVFVGKFGTSPLQDQWSSAAIEGYAKDSSKRIIPVLLPGAPSFEEVRLPNYLRTVTPVDLRSSYTEGIGNLVWALTGRRPKTSRYLRWLSAAVAVLGILLALFFGVRWLSQRGYVGAIAQAEKRVQQNPNDPSAYVALGDALRYWKRPEDAMNAYAKALHLAPSNPNADYGFSSSVGDIINTDQKISACTAALKVAPNAAEPHRGLSFAYKLKANEVDPKLRDQVVKQSISEAREAARLQPSSPVYRTEFADLLKDSGDSAAALQAYLAKKSELGKADYFDSSEEIKQLSDQLHFQSYAWGIVLSADQQLAADKNGDPSAEWEVQLATDNQLQNVALYQRPNWYGTVAQFSDQASALAALPKVRKTLPHWTSASVVQMESWCPKPELSDLRMINNRYFPLFKCSPPSPTAQVAK